VSRGVGKLQADMVSAYWINKTKPAWVIIGSRWCIMVPVQVTTSIIFEFWRSASRSRSAVVPQDTQKKTVAESVLVSKWTRRHIDCNLPQATAINTRATRCQCHLPSHILGPVCPGSETWTQLDTFFFASRILKKGSTKRQWQRREARTSTR
jgi:hypothetical protein